MKDDLYNFQDNETEQLKQYENVFALGNVVTCKGNIKASFLLWKAGCISLYEKISKW